MLLSKDISFDIPNTPVEDALAAVSSARLNLLLDHPFFGSLALRLRPVIDRTCEVLATDGVRLAVNPETFVALPAHQRMALIAHEVLHCANGHPWRQGHRDAETWARACDRAINHVLEEAGFELPAGCEKPDANQKGESAEVIYSTIQRCQSKNGQGQQGGGQGSGQPQPGNGNGNGQGQPGSGGAPFSDPGAIRQPQGEAQGETGDALENKWKIATIQAAIAVKTQGFLPGDLAAMVKEVAKPRINWRAELRRFMQQSAKDDYSWRSPNPRYLARGLYLPSLHSESMGPIVIAIDTSGSIGGGELEAFLGETEGAIEECKPEFAVVIQADARVSHVQRVERGEQFEIPTIHGRGGTNFNPVFEYVEREGIQPSCLIYLTDLCGPYPEQSPAYPVLWVCTTTNQAAWGETILLDVHA